MRTVTAVLMGFLVTSALIVGAGWASGVFLGPDVGGEYSDPTLVAALLALSYSAAAIIAGSYIADRIHETGETVAGFAVAQLFFGFGLIREFWLIGSSWYTLAAMLLVVPCAIIGRALVRRIGHHSMRMVGPI
jgi:hypothetical protein